MKLKCANNLFAYDTGEQIFTKGQIYEGKTQESSETIIIQIIDDHGYSWNLDSSFTINNFLPVI